MMGIILRLIFWIKKMALDKLLQLINSLSDMERLIPFQDT